ncbi:MAG: lysophospholipid acyltransferase family protein [Desulfuromonadales bacterium]|nr:lysophospholipid acyltransferase family protein [Desulfuromonadales bacterium]
MKKSPLSERLLFRCAPWCAAHLIRFLHRRQKPDYLGLEPLREIWARGENVILAFWHDQLLLMAPGYHGPAANVMISASKDGELIARTMHYFGIGSIRGSSTRGGRAAFREMLGQAREPLDLVFTPDGPKGPRHQVKDGVLQLARLTGRPVVPMAFACSHGYRFGSWDRFLLPFPWGRGVYAFGAPVTPREKEPLDVFRDRIQTAMEVNSRAAAESLKRYGYSAV